VITPEGDPRASAHQRPNPVARVYRHSCYSLLLSLCRPNGGEKKNLATGSTDHLRSRAQVNAPPRPSQRMRIVLFLGCCLFPAGRGFWDMSRFHCHGTHWLQLYHISQKSRMWPTSGRMGGVYATPDSTFSPELRELNISLCLGRRGMQKCVAAVERMLIARISLHILLED
jgi:hypothetical protein